MVEIGENAFSGCVSLKQLYIPSSVVILDGGGIFTGCTSLTEINVDENNPNYSSDLGILYNKEKTTLLKCPEKIELINLVIPNSVVDATSGFKNCINLRKIYIPSSTRIASYGNVPFMGCDPSLVIYTDAPNATPLASGWTEWNKIGESQYAEVVYNTTLEEYNSL